MATPPRVYLIDVHGLIFQMFHAVGSMSAPDGRPTNAVFGVTRDMLYLHQEVRPDYLLATFDAGAKTFRNDIYPSYKAHRPPPPSDLEIQIPLVMQVVERMNIPVLIKPGYEADDLIATLAHHAAGLGMQVVICSSDKDCRQLIRDNVHMLNLRKKATLDRAALLADWGIAPEQVIDYQTLVGDSTDGIPGVAGVGAKTATKLLQQFGSIENLLARIDEVTPPRAKKNIQAAHEANSLALSRDLVRLKTDVDIPIDWDTWKRTDWDGPRLLELFQELGFRGFAARVRDSLKAAGASRNAEILASAGIPSRSVKSATPDLFSSLPDAPTESPVEDDASDFAFGALAEPEDTWPTDGYHAVDTKDKFDRFLNQLRQQQRFAFDLETTSLDSFASEIVGFAFSWKQAEAWYLPVRGPEGEPTLDPPTTLDALKPIFEDPTIGKTNQNIKFDQLVLAVNGVRLRGVNGDPMLAHYLLHAGERSHGLDEIIQQYLGHVNTPIVDLIGKGKKQITLDAIPIERVKNYACEDADAAWQLTERLETELQANGAEKLYTDLEIPLIDVLAKLEHVGIRLDVPFLTQLSEEMARELQQIESEIHALAGREFNIASTKQLRQVLFEEMKLPPQKRTSLGNEPSTDQETLEKLALLGHALPSKIIEHRQVQKLKGTYVDALPEMVKPRTGRVHASFNQTVTATGRLSASNPNLQNIPARTDRGRQIRQAFLPEDGWVLLSADYSQVELRLLAHYCGDDVLRNAFAEDQDIHTAVAAEIFNVSAGEVTSEQRRMAKTVNFGVIYGMSAHGLAIRLGITREQASTFIDAYFARYPNVLKYQNDLLARVKRDRYGTTLLGRRRKFDPEAIRSQSSYQSRNQAEREAINMEVQGSAADLIKLAMLAVDRRLNVENRQSRMLLSVHDELVFEVPPEELVEVARLVREEMAGAMELAVPLKVDVSAGPNWLEGEEVAA